MRIEDHAGDTKINNEQGPTNAQSPTRSQMRNMDVKPFENVKHERHTKHYTYIKVGKQLDYRLGTVSGECHLGSSEVLNHAG